MPRPPRVLDFRDHRRELGDNRYVYAVVSRRARGLSIGINLNPGKDCSFLCRYCQVSRSEPPRVVPVHTGRLDLELQHLLALVASGGLWERAPFDTVRADLRRVADIAFAGDGEPSTCAQLATAVSVVGQCRAHHGLHHVPMRLLTNGSGLHSAVGQRALARLHALRGELWFKLDAGTPALYRQVNHSGVPFERILANLGMAARQRPVVVQSLFCALDGQPPSLSELEAWADRLAEVGHRGGRVREVQVTTVARAPRDPGCRALGTHQLEAIAQLARDRGLHATVHPGRWGRRPVLISAGATRNPIDSMRCVTANSSGGTGVAIARALQPDHAVHLLASPQAALRATAAGLESVEAFESTTDLMARMERWVRANPRGIVIHAAAVGDYAPQASGGKVSSGKASWELSLAPTPKILDHIRGWGGSELVIVSFKAAAPETEDDELVEIARKQAERTGSDLVFANVLGRLATRVALVTPTGERWYEQRSDALQALIGHALLDD
jgi:wyosine [tRNA(Phe)-imidazoG37] synthetase (radical SAM superfamily)